MLVACVDGSMLHFILGLGTTRSASANMRGALGSVRWSSRSPAFSYATNSGRRELEW